MRNLLIAAVLCTLAALPTRAEEAQPERAAESPAPQRYTLRYKFTPGETIRTEVTHSSSIRTTIKNVHEEASSHAVSVKVWEVTRVDENGRATFEHRIDRVKMRGRIGDTAEVVYDSTTGAAPPFVYKGVADTIGVPLSVVTLSPTGTVLHRENKLRDAPANVSGAQVTIPLPRDPVAVGDTWDEDFPVTVQLEGGGVRKVNARQRYKLAAVNGNVARITLATQVLEPALPPRIEVQLLQRISNGEIHFDMARGRVIAQSVLVEGSVLDFHGAGSLMKCRIEFSEKLLGDGVAEAQRRKPDAAGDAPPSAGSPSQSKTPVPMLRR